MSTRREKDDLVPISKELADSILTLCKEYEKEDQLERDSRKPLWLKLENYFNGLQRQFWNYSTREWTKPSDTLESERHYDKIVNIYRAHLESIIAALSVKLPSAIFYPEDADVIEDIETAKACVKAKSIIERYNDAKLIWIKSLLYMFNTPFAAAYVYNQKDAKYGTYEVDKYGKEPVKKVTVNLNCPECGSNIEQISLDEETKKPSEETKKCEVCGYEGIPNQEEYEEEVLEVVGSISEPKARTIIDIFSPLYVHVPFYARNLELAPYLKLEFEQHYSLVKSKYPKLAKKGLAKNATDLTMEDRQIVHLNNRNLITIKCWWIRDWAYNLLDKDEHIKELNDKFPDGLYAIVIDDQLVEINNESLDKHWTISIDPFSDYIHGEPQGKVLAPIQDIKNEIVDLQIETFEHAIPETFVDNQVLNLEAYSNSRSAPGMVYGVMRPPDGTIAQSFYTVKTATLSEENDVFARRLENEGQFVSGSFPSIFGGASTSGSKTAREYSESRAAALQRHSLTWNRGKHFWADLMSLAVPLYFDAIRRTGQDEKFVDRSKDGLGFVNLWIRQFEIEGRIGRVEADAEEDLPLSPAQIKDLLVQLMSLKDENINAALYHPNNIPFLIKALGAPDVYIPNSDHRDYQHAEIGMLIRGEPVEVNEFDNHPVHIEVAGSFLTGPSGLLLKRINPEAVMRIEEHRQMHIMRLQAPAPGAEIPVEGEAENVPEALV